MRQSGITHIWSTDSITHPTNAIALEELLVSAIRQFIWAGFFIVFCMTILLIQYLFVL